MNRNIYLLVLLALLCSCGVQYKTVPYFTDLPSSDVISDIENQGVLKIQKNDILAITVSSLDKESDDYFNRANIGVAQFNTNSGSNVTPNGYIVNNEGNIQLPYLGNVQVEGMTTSAARKLIETKLNEGGHLKEAVINLRLVNFKISVLGDVSRPGMFPVQSERITIMEALAMAGDLTITAKRNDVLLVREIEGKRQQIRLDMQKADLFSSPYYYLQNNDVLYVTPGPAKYASVDASYRNVSIILSALSVIGILISRF